MRGEGRNRKDTKKLPRAREGRHCDAPRLSVRRLFVVSSWIALLLGLSGCTRDGQFQAISMWNESRLKPYEAAVIPGQVTSAQTPPPGTVARGQGFQGDPMASGRSGGKLVTQFPVPVTRDLIARGQERFNVNCSPCHGRLGDGAGMIVQRGFPHPPDYAIPRLRRAAVGHFFDVITNGYGIMYPYKDRVPVTDRWAIAAYIRVLQETRPVVPVDLYEAERIRARERSGVTVPAEPR
jgi:mono/diheme cytochrome c family protein